MATMVMVSGAYSQVFQIVARQPAPIIPDTTGTLAHVWVPKVGVYNDTKGVIWGQKGGAPITVVNWTGFGAAGVGYWTGSWDASNTYLSSTDAGAMRPTGDFNATIVMSCSLTTSLRVNGWYDNDGHYLYTVGSNHYQYADSGVSVFETPATATTGFVVISWGRSGSTNYLKANRRDTHSASAGTPTAQTEVIIGGGGAGQEWRGSIYEFFLDSGPFDEAQVSARNSATLAFFGA